MGGDVGGIINFMCSVLPLRTTDSFRTTRLATVQVTGKDDTFDAFTYCDRFVQITFCCLFVAFDWHVNNLTFMGIVPLCRNC